ncbi:Hypothetical protein A7982_04829 [Minicystis rosea]|nr:Hypothetical protein A7982_04829 [Minicystis rosea]
MAGPSAHKPTFIVRRGLPPRASRALVRLAVLSTPCDGRRASRDRPPSDVAKSARKLTNTREM